MGQSSDRLLVISGSILTNSSCCVSSPTGGNGGEWFLPLPRTVDGTPPPAGSPTHVVSVRSGNQYLLGTYSSEKETFAAEGEVSSQAIQSQSPLIDP